MLKLYSTLITLLSLGLFLIFAMRPNWASALTIFPAWAWLWVWVLALPFYKRNAFKWIGVLWLMFILFQVEEPRSVIRGWIPSFSEDERGIFASTVNCLGSTEPLQDALDEGATVLFVQESPSFEQLSEFCKKQELELLYGLDTSLVVKGGALSAIESSSHFNTGLWEIQGTQVTLCSVRLTTTTPRLDLWSPSCWQQQAKLKKWQLRLMRKVMYSLPPNGPVMVGGDFNVPQGDKVYSLFGNTYRDSFRDGGVGWCNTIPSDYPLIRIDQIWTTKDFRCAQAYTTLSPATDHRLYSGFFVAGF